LLSPDDRPGDPGSGIGVGWKKDIPWSIRSYGKIVATPLGKDRFKEAEKEKK
jgi:hypothetical protein